MLEKKPKERVLTALSGGVDSAVAAVLLREQGYDVATANMRMWQAAKGDTCEPVKKSCCSPEDMRDAEKVAEKIGVRYYALRMEKEFNENVILPFIDDYVNARTPNPCVNCNSFVKFEIFFRRAKAVGFNRIATGHYSDVKQLSNGRYAIFPAEDSAKDQAYYLYGLSQEVLASLEFPLAKIKKPQVREIAREFDLPVAEKEESQEICFIPENNYRLFLQKKNVVFQKGFFKNSQGHIIGKHSGKENFTVGQRRGLNLALGYPAYVLRIELNGDVIVGTKDELSNSEFTFSKLNFQGLADEALAIGSSLSCMVQIRYNSSPLPAQIVRIGDDVCKVQLKSSGELITPGQALVAYDKSQGYILLGGTIDRF